MPEASLNGVDQIELVDKKALPAPARVHVVNNDTSHQSAVSREFSQGAAGGPRRKRRIIKKIVKRKMEDGTFVPMEITKTIIERDGSRSITRTNPRAASLQTVPKQYAADVNMANQARRGGASEVYGSQQPDPSNVQSLKTTSYQTTAHRASSGAIVLNRIATTTTTKVDENAPQNPAIAPS